MNAFVNPSEGSDPVIDPRDTWYCDAPRKIALAKRTFSGEANIQIKEYSYQLQIRIGNILTRANTFDSIEKILERIEKVVQKVTWTKDVIIGFSETAPLWNEDVLFIQLSGRNNLYVCLESIPEKYKGIAEEMLKKYRKQIQNAIASFDENHRDELTKLYNGKLLAKKERQLDSTDIDYIVFYFDLVWLRETNNSSGHSAWNIMLTTFSSELKAVFWTTKNVTIMRHGWDEFIVIIEIAASHTLEELQEKVTQYVSFLKKRLENQSWEKPFLNAKLGVSIHRKGSGKTSEDIIWEADPKWKKNIQYIL